MPVARPDGRAGRMAFGVPGVEPEANEHPLRVKRSTYRLVKPSWTASQHSLSSFVPYSLPFHPNAATKWIVAGQSTKKCGPQVRRAASSGCTATPPGKLGTRKQL